MKGPIELVDADPNPEPEEDENEEGSKYHMEKLRQYQLNRLKYYYAVITLDDANSANKIYTGTIVNYSESELQETFQNAMAWSMNRAPPRSIFDLYQTR